MEVDDSFPLEIVSERNVRDSREGNKPIFGSYNFSKTLIKDR